MSSAHPALADSLPTIEAWLADRCLRYEALAKDATYALWAFEHPAHGEGVLEWIDDPQLSQGGAVLSLALTLRALPPIRTAQDAQVLLQAAEWLAGITLVCKDFGKEGALMVQLKELAEKTSAQALDQMLRRLVEAQHFFA